MPFSMEYSFQWNTDFFLSFGVGLMILNSKAYPSNYFAKILIWCKSMFCTDTAKILIGVYIMFPINLNFSQIQYYAELQKQLYSIIGQRLLILLICMQIISKSAYLSHTNN